jgi:hypothetical protein
MRAQGQEVDPIVVLAFTVKFEVLNGKEGWDGGDAFKITRFRTDVEEERDDFLSVSLVISLSDHREAQSRVWRCRLRKLICSASMKRRASLGSILPWGRSAL